ncbi:XRE family transcriptional regulator, partial [Lactobacillus crispatus]
LSLAAIRGDKERAEQIKRELIDVGYEIARKWII